MRYFISNTLHVSSSTITQINQFIFPHLTHVSRAKVFRFLFSIADVRRRYMRYHNNVYCQLCTYTMIVARDNNYCFPIYPYPNPSGYDNHILYNLYFEHGYIPPNHIETLSKVDMSDMLKRLLALFCLIHKINLHHNFLSFIIGIVLW